MGTGAACSRKSLIAAFVPRRKSSPRKLRAMDRRVARTRMIDQGVGVVVYSHREWQVRKTLAVTIWNENRHEKADARVAAVYPNGIHGALADFLSRDPG